MLFFNVIQKRLSLRFVPRRIENYNAVIRDKIRAVCADFRAVVGLISRKNVEIAR